MKAAFLDGPGKEFSLRTTQRVAPAEGEATVRLVAAAFNHLEGWTRRGAFPALPFPIVPGSDGAGLIIETGAGVDPQIAGREVLINPGIDWKDGEIPGANFRILGLAQPGTFAEFVTVPAACLRPKPPHLSFERAAALPMAGVTAYRALVRRAQIRPGENLLITGIGGGVALFALQIAIALGCTVYVNSSSDEKIIRARQLGAAGGVNYREEGWKQKLREMAGAFDVILDGAGGQSLTDVSELARPGGRLVSFGMTSGTHAQVNVQMLFSRQLTFLGSMMGSDRDFDDMLDFVSQHRIEPVIDEVLRFEDINAGFAKLEGGQRFGKVVLSFQ